MALVVVIALLAGSLYAAARFVLNSHAGESISMGAFLVICIVLIAWKMHIRRFADLRLLFAPPLKPWLSLIVTFAVVATGIVRYGLPIPQATLDALFALILWTAFSCLFIKRTAN
jgi:hypothetical protein